MQDTRGNQIVGVGVDGAEELEAKALNLGPDGRVVHGLRRLEDLLALLGRAAKGGEDFNFFFNLA